MGYEYSVTDIYHKIERVSKDTHEKLSDIAGNATGIYSRIEDIRQHISDFGKPLNAVSGEIVKVRFAVWVIALVVLVHVIHHW